MVICYHRISKIKIQEHLLWFKRNYSLMQLNDLLDKSINSKQRNSYKYPEIAITMDDCYENDFTNMINTTLKEQVHCTYFVPLAYVQENKSFWSLRIINSINNLILPKMLILDNGETKEIINESQKQDFIKKFILELQDNNTQTIEIESKVYNFLKKNELVDKADKIINLNTIKEHSKNPFGCFQSHTLTHPKLNLCSEEELKNEFIGSMQALNQFDFGYKQEIICYPYGSYKLIGNSYKIAGNTYKYGVTLVPGVIKKNTNSLLIPRIGIYENDTIYSIELKFLKAQLLNSLNKFKL
jgi:peptidoglycan/xylan/chitin deacetylase (PgdA/CDA1 family)